MKLIIRGAGVIIAGLLGAGAVVGPAFADTHRDTVTTVAEAQKVPQPLATSRPRGTGFTSGSSKRSTTTSNRTTTGGYAPAPASTRTKSTSGYTSGTSTSGSTGSISAPKGVSAKAPAGAVSIPKNARAKGSSYTLPGTSTKYVYNKTTIVQVNNQYHGHLPPYGSYDYYNPYLALNYQPGGYWYHHDYPSGYHVHNGVLVTSGPSWGGILITLAIIVAIVAIVAIALRARSRRPLASRW